MRIRIGVILFMAVLPVATLCTFAKNKDKYVDYRAQAKAAIAETETKRYFLQLGYVIDEHTGQCNNHPTPETIVFRHTGEKRAGISSLRFVIVNVRQQEGFSTIHVESCDHLRSGLSFELKHWDSNQIHRNWDEAFADIGRRSEAANSE
jgi:hypothetical protein